MVISEEQSRSAVQPDQPSVTIQKNVNGGKAADYALKGLKQGLRAANAAGSRVASAASATPEKVRDSDSGVVLAVAGFAVFFFDLIFHIDNFWLALIIATFFMFYSTLTIFESEGIVLVTLFFVWYIFLGGRYDLAFIRYYGPILVAVGMLVQGLVKKVRHTGTFSAGALGELKGIVPVLFFVFDIGLIDILTGYFRIPLTVISTNLLRFVPWWGLLGLKYVRSDKSGVAVAKVLAMFYILILAVGSLGPGVYGQYQESLIAGPLQAFEARQAQQKQVRAENPLSSYGTCLITGRLAELDVCVKEEQKKSLAESTCKNIGFVSGPDFDQCVKDELARLERGGARGATDSSRKEFLKAKFEAPPKSFPRVVFGEPKKIYPSTLLIENPQQQQLGVEVSCKFMRGSLAINGLITINGQETSRYSSNFKNDPVRIGCQPQEELSGQYNLEISATLTDILTTSTLTRVFVKNQQDRERWEAEIKSTALSGFDAGLSQSADEFARLNYGFGNFPDDPIIISSRPVLLTVSIEDLGSGQLSRIKSYSLSGLLSRGFFPTSGNVDCLQRGEAIIPQKVKNYNLGECFLELPAEYQQFDVPYITETFEASLLYDYNLTQKIPGIKVEKIQG